MAPSWSTSFPSAQGCTSELICAWGRSPIRHSGLYRGFSICRQVSDSLALIMLTDFNADEAATFEWIKVATARRLVQAQGGSKSISGYIPALA
jgi:hypothetical protein